MFWVQASELSNVTGSQDGAPSSVYGCIRLPTNLPVSNSGGFLLKRESIEPLQVLTARLILSAVNELCLVLGETRCENHEVHCSSFRGPTGTHSLECPDSSPSALDSTSIKSWFETSVVWPIIITRVGRCRPRRARVMHLSHLDSNRLRAILVGLLSMQYTTRARVHHVRIGQTVGSKTNVSPLVGWIGKTSDCTAISPGFLYMDGCKY